MSPVTSPIKIMSEAKFILKEPKSTDKTLIYLFYNFNYQRLKYSTGEKIAPKNWNPTKQRAKETRSFPEHFELNNRLNYIENSISNAFRKIINDSRIPNSTILRNELNKILKGEKEKRKPDLFNFIEIYINESKTSKSKTLINAYHAVHNRLIEFSALKHFPLDFDTIDLEFYSRFRDFLLYDKDLLNNTVGKYIKNLKLFLNEATERGINTNMIFRSKKFKVIQDETDSIYLNEDELGALYSLDLASNSTLSEVRDLFLIGCYTGLRFSDFINLNKRNIVEKGQKKLIQIRTQKTDATVVIPMHPIVEDIWLKYNNSIPKPYSNQRMNIHLKTVGQLAALEDKQQITKNQGTKRNVFTLKKYEMLSTHTARRSFATNMYLAGVPTVSIMLITGHRTEKAFLKYIKVTKEQNATKLLEHPFFN